jgi:hypothetical protein
MNIMENNLNTVYEHLAKQGLSAETITTMFEEAKANYKKKTSEKEEKEFFLNLSREEVANALVPYLSLLDLDSEFENISVEEVIEILKNIEKTLAYDVKLFKFFNY